jgi:hypothetical protein
MEPDDGGGVKGVEQVAQLSQTDGQCRVAGAKGGEITSGVKGLVVHDRSARFQEPQRPRGSRFAVFRGVPTGEGEGDRVAC